MKYILAIIIQSVCLLACTPSKKGEEVSSVKQVNLDQNVQEEIVYSSFVDSITYIPLETNEACFLRRIKDVISTDTMLFVLDQSASAVFLFNKQGEFIRSIKHHGLGLGEYRSINQMAYNKKNKTLIVVSSCQKILEYDLQGTLKQELRTKEYFTDIEVVDDDMYLLSRIQRKDAQGAVVVLMDSNGNITKDVLPKNPLYKIDSSDAWEMITIGDKVHFVSPQLDNTLYSYDLQNGLEKEIEIAILPEVPSDFYESKPRMIGLGNHYYRTVYRESSEWLNLIYWSESKSTRRLLYHKSTGKYVLGKNFKNDIDNNGEGEFLSASANNTFMGFVESNKEDDNPIIQVLHLKENFSK